jgi:hypothetical protein
MESELLRFRGVVGSAHTAGERCSILMVEGTIDQQRKQISCRPVKLAEMAHHWYQATNQLRYDTRCFVARGTLAHKSG